VHLGIQVKERRRMELAFEGNRAVRPAHWRATWPPCHTACTTTLTRLRPRKKLDKAYRERGHMLVKTTWRRERIDQDADRIVFHG